MPYKIPAQHYFRLHHVRPRFKNDVESVLLFICRKIANMKTQDEASFNRELFDMIQSYPGNIQKSDKTIHNWRTEISSLFGLVQSKDGKSKPGFYASLLAQNEDLIEFFRYFLLSFQYPGAHIKPNRVREQVEAGVNFHPGKFIVELFFEGQKIVEGEKQFHVKSQELTALVFNDLRVTATRKLSAKDIAHTVLNNRAKGVQYDTTGDVTRYAQDILDYMVLADILDKRPNTGGYYMRPSGVKAAVRIAQESPVFHGYDDFFGSNHIENSDYVAVEEDWLDFVNEDRVNDAFAGDILEGIVDAEVAPKISTSELVEGLKKALDGNAQDIGQAGESIALTHEYIRLSECARVDLATKVKKIPDYLGVGYDLQSFEGVVSPDFGDIQRYIEVKTTRSKNKVLESSFVMTANEWNAARTNGDAYYVYRIMISEGKLRMFVIRDPYEEDRKGTLKMTPRNGAEITFTEDAGVWEPLLVKIGHGS